MQTFVATRCTGCHSGINQQVALGDTTAKWLPDDNVTLDGVKKYR